MINFLSYRKTKNFTSTRLYLNSEVSARKAPMTTPKSRSPLPASSTIMVNGRSRLFPSDRWLGSYKNSPSIVVESESESWASKAFSSTSAIVCIQGAVLRVKTRKPARNRALVALLLPAFIILWVVGWSLYWIGRQQDSKRTDSKFSRDNVRIEVIPIEERQEVVA